MGSRGITRALSVAAALVLGSASGWAQTFYQGVQYQYGRYGEIFYGGVNGSVTGDPFVFSPEYARNRMLPTSEAGYPNGLQSPYTPAAVRTADVMGWPSPADRSAAFHAPYSRRFPQIFSDIDPGVDVSRRGFTINDARNEAYFNVPLYQTGFPGAPEAVMPEMASVRGRPIVGGPSPAEKARELLAWAKATNARGNKPKLVDALVKEAAKYDAGAANKTKAEMK